MLKRVMKSIANRIESVAYHVFGCTNTERDSVNGIDRNQRRHRALLIVSKNPSMDYDFDYMEDE